MEMPMDVLNNRLGKLRDSGILDGDNTAYAIDIDQELREKFLINVVRGTRGGRD